MLYITISTGIGDALIVDGQIDPDMADSEAGHMVLEYEGQLQKWQDIASGQALVQRYGQPASRLNDPAAWRHFAHAIALGLNELIAVIQPEAVILGGGVGSHFAKFGDYLKADLAKMADKMINQPVVLPARRPQSAVIFGCYGLIKQKLSSQA